MANIKQAIRWIRERKKVHRGEPFYVVKDGLYLSFRGKDDDKETNRDQRLNFDDINSKKWKIYEEESKCEKCGRVFGAATWDEKSIEQYKKVLKKTGYKVLCETCTFQLKEKEQTLSDEIEWAGDINKHGCPENQKMIRVEDVKEFIKYIIDRICVSDWQREEIKEKAGDKLT